jgi:hypothetical protein
MTQAVRHSDQAQEVQEVQGVQQFALHEGWMATLRRSGVAAPASRTVLCAGCREKEARYGFRDEEDDPTTERPRTLCFTCFRVELTRRQAVKARLARGWNARQVSLPLEETLKQLTHRRRQAQIAARHALGLR